MTEKYKVTGMSCAACSARVERAVSSIDGVDSCTVNLLTGDMSVEGSATREEVIDAVENAGYGIKEDSSSAKVNTENDDDTHTRALLLRLFVSLGLVIAIMYLSMGHMIGLPNPFGDHYVALGITQMVIAAAVMVINRHFFISGVKGVIHGAPNMDTLVSLGSFASFGYSVAVLVMMIKDTGGDGAKYGL